MATMLTRFLLNTATSAFSALKMNNEAFDGPTVSDVLMVKALLQQASRLPLEIIDTVIDFAQYWPHTTASIETKVAAYGQNQNLQAGSNHKDNVFVLRSLPLGYTTNGTDKSGSTFRFDLGKYRDKTINNSTLNVDTDEAISQASSAMLQAWTAESIPRGEFPCRKVVFTLKSRDQGWGGNASDHGTYHCSFTWFDVGLERIFASYGDANTTAEENWSMFESAQPANRGFARGGTVLYNIGSDWSHHAATAEDIKGTVKHQLLPSSVRLQSNIIASRNVKEHIITWSADDKVDPESAEGDELEELGRGRASMTGEFVRSLQVGDIVTIWAKARFPGWHNQIEDAKIEVYWAV